MDFNQEFAQIANTLDEIEKNLDKNRKIEHLSILRQLLNKLNDIFAFIGLNVDDITWDLTLLDRIGSLMNKIISIDE